MYTKATTIDEARAARAELRAGGTDLQERLRTGVSRLPIVDVHGIPELDRIEVRNDGVDIGALVTIREVGEHPQLRALYPALTLPAQLLATPQARSRGTVGGVLCQRTRCWYYRNPHLACPKKGNADACPSREGNHEFGVVFDFGPCVYPHPSSIGAALLAYDASLTVTGRGVISAAELYGDGSHYADHTLQPGEMITHVHLPAPLDGEQGAYQRLMSRALAEWPLVEVVVRLALRDGVIAEAHVAIGGVANIPFVLREVADALRGQRATDEVLEAAARRSTNRANPLPQTGYKVAMVEALVLSTLRDARDRGRGALDFAM